MATIAELEAIRARLLARREQIIREAGGFGNFPEGSSALAQVRQVNRELAEVVIQIEKLMFAQSTSNTQQTVSRPNPPRQDPTAERTESIASSTDVNTNSGDPGDPGPARNPKTADNQANDDNPQTSNTAALGRASGRAPQSHRLHQTNLLCRSPTYWIVFPAIPIKPQFTC
jgi:hypothetical protein